MKPTKEQAFAAVRTMIEYIGDDPDREGLLETPDRVVRSWEKLFGGYKQSAEQVFSKSFGQQGYDQMILVGPVEYWSTCEHHLLPFYGSAFIAYLPGASGRVVGLSKLARVVEVFARRLQIQENLTQQIADAVGRFADAQGVAVLVRGKHLCMVSRGVEKQSAWMTTAALRGVFLESIAAREEFYRLTEGAHG